MLNVVVVEGVLARPAQLVELPSGTRLVQLEVTVRRPDGPTETIPVSWFEASAWAGELDVGESVVVAGRVRRRFFRSGGVTHSRTEVVAGRVARSTSTTRVRSVLGEAITTLVAALGDSMSSAALGSTQTTTADRDYPATSTGAR